MSPQSFVSFGDLGMYVASSSIPEGDYALEFHVQMYQAETQTGVKRGPARLCVIVNFHDLNDPARQGKNAYHQSYSLGTNADKLFAPDPQTGKRLVPIPGVSGGNLNMTTNWAYLLKSLYDCGLPQGVFINDLRTIDGVWAHVAPIPEPEERKGFQSAAKTGEAAQEEIKRSGFITVVTEIKPNGKPWEGGGGIPNGAVAAPVAAGAPTTARPVAAPAAVPPTPATNAVPLAAGVADDAVLEHAANGITEVLSNPANSVKCAKVKVKTECFKHLTSNVSAEVANQVQSAIANDAVFESVLGTLGYKLQGAFVVVAG